MEVLGGHSIRLIQSADPGYIRIKLAELFRGREFAVMPVGANTRLGVPECVNSDVAAVVETSGSTARPKRVWFTSQRSWMRPIPSFGL